MQLKRRVITVGTTFFLAAATGHVMQNGETISARLRGETALASQSTVAAMVPAMKPAPAASGPVEKPVEMASLADPAKMPAAAPVDVTASAASTAEPVAQPTAALPVTTASGLPDLPKIQPVALGTSLKLAERVEALDTAPPTGSLDDSAASKNYTVFGIACADPSLTLEPMARAMIKMKLSAPCFANERVTVAHEGLIFTMATDKAGDLEVVVPALAAKAFVNVRFASGDEIGMSQEVSGLDGLNRVAVTWTGTEGLHLNAYENGATFGGAGHVSYLAPRDRATDEGGFLVALGDPAVDHPLMAEVYTAPVATTVDEVVVEANVTEATCNTLLTGRTISKRGGAAPTSETLSFAMPSCDAVGDFLMLSLGTIPSSAVALAENGR